MSRRPIAAIAVLLPALAASALYAQTAPTTIEEISIESLLNTPIEISSTTAATIFETTSTVSVIDREMIRQYNFRSVAEALGSLPGFDVIRTHIMRNVPISRGILQEHYANKVLVMINGVAQWGAVTGEANLDRVDINDVERIEVLRGPASVLYGTNAYSGAVNIITKRQQQAPLEGHFDFGTDGHLGAGAHIGWGSEDRSFFIGANSYAESGRKHSFVDERGELGYLDEFLAPSNLTAAGHVGGHTFLFNASSITESYLGTTPEYAVGIGHPSTRRGYLFNYGFERTRGALTLSSSLSYDWAQRNISRSRDDNTRSNIEGSRLSPSLAAHYKASDRFAVDFGAEVDYRRSNEYNNYDVRRDVVLADNNMRSRNVSEYSAFAQGAWSAGRLRLLAGSRFTHNELFGSNLSSRATAVFVLGDDNAIKVIAGQSYRAPSLFELYFQTPTNTTYGNLALEPETSTSYELAYLRRAGNFFAQVLAYHAVYDDKIFRTRRFPDSTTDKSTYYVNGASFDADGLELELKYQLPRSTGAFFNYNYVNGGSGDRIEAEDHYNFKYVPKHNAAAGLSLTRAQWLISTVVNYTGETNGPREPVDAQTSVDLNGAFSQAIGTMMLRHKLSAKNLTDEDIMFPEFVRRNLNAVPSGFGRQIVYTLQVTGAR
ncbi:MAG: TonB-dependent receptor [Thermoanaerobaculia bacterium]